MKLTPKTRILELTRAYPFLVEALAGFNPRFGALKSPVVRNTLGRAASLAKVARIGGIELRALMEFLRTSIEARSGERAEVEWGGHPADEKERQEALKGIIRDLHAGRSVEELRARFADLIEDLNPAEIAKMEQALVAEGMPESEITRLCDLHVQVFKDQLEDVRLPDLPPDHPVAHYMAENRALEREAARLLPLLEGPDPLRRAVEIGPLLERFAVFNLHYLRKENQLFPYMEKRGVETPPKVMWEVHDQIRALLKGCRETLGRGEAALLQEHGKALVAKSLDMIFKEERILFPMALERLEAADWAEIRKGDAAIGYALIEPPAPPEQAAAAQVAGQIPLETGSLTPEQVNLLFTHLPVELSFTDERHIVRFYSQTKERIFPRSPGVIGRHVENCHPPKSLDRVKRILADFESGARDVAEFWIPFQGKLVHIRYFAIRDRARRFRGTLEVVQDVTAIQALKGERRLLDGV